MPQRSSTSAASGAWFPSALFLVFLTLKLTGHIDWSWWWVSAPLWAPLALALALIAVAVIGAFVVVKAVYLAAPAEPVTPSAEKSDE